MQSTTKDLSATSTALAGDKAGLEAEVQELRVKYLQVRAQLADAKTQKLEEGAALSAKDEVTSTRVSELERALAAYKDRERKLQGRVAEAEATEGELSDTVERLSDKISEMRSENERVAALLAAQRRDLDKVLSEEVETEGVLTATQQRLREWQARAQSLESQFVDASRLHAADVERQRSEWGEERRRLQTALSELRHENAVLSGQALQGGERTSDMARMLEDARTEAKTARNAAQRSTARAADSEAEVSHLTTQLMDARASVTSLTSQVSALRDELTTSQLQAELAAERAAIAHKAVSGAERRAEDAEVENAALRATVADLEASLEAAEGRRAAAEARLAASGLLAAGADETLDSAVGRASQYELEAQLAKEATAAAEARTAAAEADRDAAQETLTRVQDELRAHKRALKQYQTQLNEMRWAAVVNARNASSAALQGASAPSPSASSEERVRMALTAAKGVDASDEHKHIATGFYAGMAANASSRHTGQRTRLGLAPAPGSARAPNASHALKAAVLGRSTGRDFAGEKTMVSSYTSGLAGMVAPGRSVLPPPSPLPSSRVAYKSAIGRAIASGQLAGTPGQVE